MMFIYVGLLLVAGYFILSAMSTFLSVGLSLIVVPFVLLHDFLLWICGKRKRDVYGEVRADLDRHERFMNKKYERLYFNDVPASGTKDKNGIPYL